MRHGLVYMSKVRENDSVIMYAFCQICVQQYCVRKKQNKHLELVSRGNNIACTT